ncbi:MAG TPA: TlpA disulfide reductase family protein, partial [Gemmataceae bacterium]|nr:TlpA disulfide reductase family protein [Gemmataceae bacterium]
KPADPQAVKVADEVQALKKEQQAAQKKAQALFNKMQTTKDENERKELQQKLQDQVAEMRKADFAGRFLEIAEKNGGSPAAVEAIAQALRNSGGTTDKTFTKSVELLQKNYVKSPGLKPVLKLLAYSGEDSAEQFVREVLEKNPDRVTRARAARALLDVAEETTDFAKRLKDDKQTRAQVELQRGKEFVQKMIDKGEKAHGEQRELEKLIAEKYRDVIPDLSVGRKVPEVTSEDVNGKAVKLSDLKGKVVVLDFWATWCGPCKAMIPHEREMVQKLKDKPFALVSISADDDKQTLKEFLADNNMPWSHWWSGSEGGPVEEWNVKYFPTIYVIDAKGVIRHKDLRGKELEEAVNDLLKEMEEKKG